MQLIKDRKRLVTGFITVFVLLQPFIDVFTSLAIRNSMGASLGVLVRSFFMAVITAYCILLSKTDKKLKLGVALYMIATGGYLMFYFAHFFKTGGLFFAFTNIKEAVKVFYFVFLLLGFYLIYKEYKFTVSDTVLSITAALYMSIIVIAFVTGTSYPSYKHGEGFVGWFYSANEIGAIIGILAPYLLVNSVKGLIKALKEKKYPLFALYSFLCLETVFCALFIGTKAVFLAFMLFVAIALALALFKAYKKAKTVNISRKAVSSALIAAVLCVSVFSGLYIVSPIRANLTGKAVVEYTYLQKGTPFDPVGEDPVELPGGFEPGEGNEQKDAELYTVWDAEKEPLPVPVSVLNKVFNNRIVFSIPVSRHYMSSSWVEKLFGVGYVNRSDAVYDIEEAIEIDIVTIFLRHGVVGFVLYFVPAFTLAFWAISRIFSSKRDIKKRDCVLVSLFGIAVAFGMSVLAGHVLIAPAVSVYIAIAFIKLCANVENAEEHDMTEIVDKSLSSCQKEPQTL